VTQSGCRRRRPERAERKVRPWTWIAIAVFLVAIGAAWLLLLRECLGLFERWITGLGIWGVALFALVFIIATISLAPEWPLTVAAGMLYGAWGFSNHYSHRDNRCLPCLPDCPPYRARPGPPVA
jgi:hypothetical protein